MTGILIQRGNTDTDTHTGRLRCEDENKEQRDASTSHGMPKIASKPIQSWKRGMKQIVSHGPQKEPTC